MKNFTGDAPADDFGRDSFDSEELRLLLAGDVLGDLDGAERSRLTALTRNAEGFESNRESLQQVAAAIRLASELCHPGISPEDMSLAEGGNRMSLKPELIQRIRRDASIHLPSTSTTQEPTSRSNTGAASWLTSPWVGWCVAVSLAIVCVGLWIATRSSDSGAAMASGMTAVDAAAWTQVHPNAIQLSWKVQDPALANPGDGGDAGSVTWDSKSQTGFMRLNMLPINDASVEQYQLWIIDPKRDDEPIDGGVFDIAQRGDTIISIRAKLNVIDPAGFAVTVEKPGGVVVSDQSRLPLLVLVSQ